MEGDTTISTEEFLLVQESPESYEKAMNSKQKEKWKKVKESEINS